MAKVTIARGIQSSYNAIVSKDSDTIYICTDTGNIYLGSQTLFESSAYIDSSITGKTVTFTTHGANGATGTDTLDLSAFQTAEEVQAAIASSLSSVYKPAGSLTSTELLSNASILLVEENIGNVYNVGRSFTTTSDFLEGSGKTYPAGTNVVIITRTTGQITRILFDVLAGYIDLSGYMQLVSGTFTSGNFASLKNDGSIEDSGFKPDDFKTKQTAVTPESSNTNGSAGGQYVEQVTQDTNGEITVTRKKLPNFPGSGSVGTASTDADAWKTLVHDASLNSSRVLSGNTKTIPAATPSNDGYMTATQASKLDGITAGGEPNVLEGVQVSGTDLTIDANKKVNIVTGTAYNASTNKMATMADVAAGAMDWGSF